MPITSVITSIGHFTPPWHNRPGILPSHLTLFASGSTRLKPGYAPLGGTFRKRKTPHLAGLWVGVECKKTCSMAWLLASVIT